MKTALKIIGITTLVILSLFTLYSFLGIIIGNQTDVETSSVILPISVPSLFTGLFFMALSEIIKILQQIRDKKQ